MQRLTAWWRGLSRRGKAVALAAVLVVLVVVGGSGQKPGAETAPSPPTAAQPTAAPVPATPAPTRQPTARPTVAPTPKSTPEPFEPIVLKGNSDKIAKFTAPEGLALIAEATYSGSGNFAVWSIAADGSRNDLLVNAIGKYTGTVLLDDAGFGSAQSVALQVEGSGSWTIGIRSLFEAPVWNGGATLKNAGDSVILISPPSS